MKSYIEQLQDLCRMHDWTYDQTDDHSVWRKGNESWKNILRMQEKCKENGYTNAEIFAVMSKYYDRDYL